MTSNWRRVASLVAALGAVGPVFFLLPAASPAATDPKSSSSTVRLVGPPRRLTAGPYAGFSRIVGRAEGGFLLAYAQADELVVAEYAEDGRREKELRLGSLGYSGTSNVRTLAPLAPRSWVAAWDLDHHYAGFRGAHLFVVRGDVRRFRSGTRRAPALVADGTGGAIGFYRGAAATHFGRWSANGRLLSQHAVQDVGYPQLALPFRDGVLLSSGGPAVGVNAIDWFDARGQRVEGVVGYGGALATDGKELVVEVNIVDQRLTVRTGGSPAQLGPGRTIAAATAGHALNGQAVAAIRGRGGVVAWSEYPPDGPCGVWVRALTTAGEPGAGKVCAAPAGGHWPTLGVSGHGQVWLGWRTAESIPTGGYVWALWRRRLDID